MDGGKGGVQHFLLKGLALCGVLVICVTSGPARGGEPMALRLPDSILAQRQERARPRVIRNSTQQRASDRRERSIDAREQTWIEDEPQDVMGRAEPIPAEHSIHSDEFHRGLPPNSRRGRIIKVQHAMPDGSEMGDATMDSPAVDSEMPSGAVETEEGTPIGIEPGAEGATYPPRYPSQNAPGGEAPWGPASCNDAAADCDACCMPCAPPIPYWAHKTGVWGEYQYLRPRNAEVPYAVPIDGPAAPIIGNGIQNGPTATVNPGYQSAFAVGGSWALSDFSSIRVRYAHFNQLTSDSATISPPDVLRALVTHPLGTNAATDTLDARASLKLNYDIGDVLYAGVLAGGENFVVNYFGGGRYLNFQQDFNAVFSTIGTTPVATNIHFNGGGIQLGLDGERRNCRTGLLVYGRAASSFVVGQFDANYQQSDATGVAIAANSFNAARIVPMLDLELGVGWTGRQGRLRLTAGYVVQAWFNTVTTNDYIQAVQANNFNGLSNTVTFDGLTVRGTLQF